MKQKLVIKILLLILLTNQVVFAASKVEISQGNLKPIPVVMIPVVPTDDNSKNIAMQINRIIVADLQSTDLFNIVDGTIYKEEVNVKTPPNYDNWLSSGANFILKSQIKRIDNNRYELAFRIFNAITKQASVGYVYSFKASETTIIAHDVGDEIYSAITGERGYFNTRLTFIDERGSELNRYKRIMVSDYNGENAYVVPSTPKGAILITPRFSRDGRYIAYVVIRKLVGVELYIYDTLRKTNYKLGNFSNMTFSPRFSPDSKYLLFCMSKGSYTSIYELNLASGRVVRLTNNSTIDVSPSYSPDGKKIVFASDRTGVQQIYIMDRNGSNVRRVSYGEGGYYATPSWSPRGDLIAYTRFFNDSFFIGVMSTNGDYERYLTKVYSGESPIWSPNGRRVLYYGAQNKSSYDKNKIYSIDITGIGERPLATPSNASDPDLSYFGVQVKNKRKIIDEIVVNKQ